MLQQHPAPSLLQALVTAQVGFPATVQLDIIVETIVACSAHKLLFENHLSKVNMIRQWCCSLGIHCQF